MDGAAVEKLYERFNTPTQVGDFIVVPDKWTAHDPASLIKPGPLAAALGVTTLAALCEYLKANRDALALTDLVVHVASPSKVHVLGKLADRTRVRETFTIATAADYTDGFLNKFWSLEEFLIALQVRFADSDDRQKLLRLLSSVKSEDVKTALDNGMTQVVEARNGVALVANHEVPNPVSLSPYRTFREVTQPESLFVLRLRSGANLPESALFSADGGIWQLTAIQRVRDWLVLNLPEGMSVLA
jgi:hypothetical protein